MTRLVYDTSFEGYLTAVFEVYERKLEQVEIVPAYAYQPQLEDVKLDIVTDSTKAERVWKGLRLKISPGKLHEVYQTFLSERADREHVILCFTRHVFNSASNVEHDLGHKAVLQISQVARQVHREKHRMEAFVRFQQTKDNLYYASIEPDFNVLPLLAKHFKDRYADQHWIIYDRKRHYGLYYNSHTGLVTEIAFDKRNAVDTGFLPASVVHEDEPAYQQLWRQYFASVNIGARKNTKLHTRHVPLRYWKYLPEKQ